MADTFGYGFDMSIMPTHIYVWVWGADAARREMAVRKIAGDGISFHINALLSRLSWEVADKHLDLPTAVSRFASIRSTPPTNRWEVLLLTSFANASFCKLFGGDLISMSIVFSATVTGMFLKQQMQKKKINHYIVFIVSAFVASLCASTSLIFHTTSEIAMATSVLYLVPGVPLINGVIDVVEGYVLTGFSRLTEASLLIISIAIGLSLTLLMVKNSLI